MPLADSSRLRALPDDAWRAVSRRLRAIGLTADSGDAHVKRAMQLYDPERAPMMKWHLRRAKTPVADAMRLLMFFDPLTDAEVRGVFDDAVAIERLVEAGFLDRAPDGRFVAAYVTNLVNGTYILCDDVRVGGNAVMGLGPTTAALCRASRPMSRAGSALDLGCGAGTVGLLLASACERVVATDINARALDVARVNVVMSGAANIELRQGDMFAPVAGLAFDLVVSQPPFIAHHDGAPGATYLFGGPRGDELAMRLLRELPPHLAPGGVAIVLVQWPVAKGDVPIERRVASAIAEAKVPDLSVLFVEAPDEEIEEHCTAYARVGRDTTDAQFEATAMARRDHFERMKIDAVRPAYAVVRRGAKVGAPTWARRVKSRSFAEVEVSRARIDSLVAARDLLVAGEPSLLAARLRVPEGTTMAEGEGGKVVAHLPDEALGGPVAMDARSFGVLSKVHEADDVGAALKAGVGAGGAEAIQEIRDALTWGLLEVR
jgi:methylase of polypeptide subunit release factors